MTTSDMVFYPLWFCALAFVIWCALYLPVRRWLARLRLTAAVDRFLVRHYAPALWRLTMSDPVIVEFVAEHRWKLLALAKIAWECARATRARRRELIAAALGETRPTTGEIVKGGE